MAKKSSRVRAGLVCAKCGSQNYVTTKNKVSTPDALAMNKFCSVCNAHQNHKEKKKLG